MASRRTFLRTALASTIAGPAARAGTPRPTHAGARPEDDAQGLGPHAEPPEEPRTLAGPGTMYYAVAISRDGSRVVAAGRDDVIYSWSGISGARLADVGQHPRAIGSVEISRDGRRALTRAYSGVDMVQGAISRTGIARGSSVKVWDLGFHRLIDAYDDHDVEIRPVFGAPDGSRVYFLGEGGGLYVWDVGHRPPRRFKAEAQDEVAEKIRTSLFPKASDDGTRVVGGGMVSVNGGMPRFNLKIWDVETGRVRSLDLSAANAPKGSVLTSPDGRFEVRLDYPRTKQFEPASRRRFLTTLDLRDGRVVRQFEVPPNIMTRVHLVALSEDNTRFAVGSEGPGRDQDVILWIWNVRDGHLLGSYHCPENSLPVAVAFLDDGRLRVVSKTSHSFETPNGGGDTHDTLLIWETGPA